MSALLPENAISIEDFCNIYEIENYYQFKKIFQAILRNENIHFYLFDKLNKDTILLTDKQVYWGELFDTEIEEIVSYDDFPLLLQIDLEDVQEIAPSLEICIEQILLEDYGEKIPHDIEVFDYIENNKLPGEKDIIQHKALERQHDQKKLNPNQRIKIIEIINKNKALSQLRFSREELEKANYIKSAKSLTAVTGSKTNKQNHNDTKAILNSIINDLPPNKKIKKDDLEKLGIEKAKENETNFNTTAFRAFYKHDMPIEKKYKQGEK